MDDSTAPHEMTRVLLSPHPTTPCRAATELGVEVARDGETLSLVYRLRGEMAALSLPGPAAPVRTDGLWRHSCFEAFVQGPGAAGYCEFNLAPSGAWAAYRFQGRRDGMADLAQAPMIRVEADAGSLVLHGRLTVPIAGPWRIGLTAVIEGRDGALSYWALAHPGGQPDFHDPAGFALGL